MKKFLLILLSVSIISLALVSCGKSDSIKIEDVTISGEADKALTAAVDVKINLNGYEFKEAIAANTDVKAWITNIPAGLNAKIKTAVTAGDVSATISVDGTPTEAKSEAIKITIPKASIKDADKDIEAKVNKSAKFDIKASTVPSATVADATISGTAGSALAAAVDITITIANDKIKTAIEKDADLASWITNLPANLTAKAKAAVAANATSVVITIASKEGDDGNFGAELNAPIAITIPAGALTTTTDTLTVKANANAKFAIAAATDPSIR